MNIKVEWNNIITNAISTLVIAIVVGACAIVWQGATSVDEKVQTTKNDLQKLIEVLSDKLASYEVQMQVMIKNQSNLLYWANDTQLANEIAYEVNSVPVVSDVKLPNGDSHVFSEVEQKALSKDIRQQIQSK